jgi:ribose transport system ATP-binding protein
MMLTAEDVVKVFPGVRALDGATLNLSAGSVHALLGENGAGKSTLVKILTGVYQPDGGRITVGGQEVGFAGPLDAQRAGIGVVHQERNLIPAFTIAENVVLHHLPNRWGVVDRAQMQHEARRCLALLDLDLDPQTPVWQLSVAQAQLVEIAKALSLDSRVLLLDEPRRRSPATRPTGSTPSSGSCATPVTRWCWSATSSRRSSRSPTRSRCCGTGRAWPRLSRCATTPTTRSSI